MPARPVGSKPVRPGLLILSSCQQAAESFEVPEAAAVYVQESADTDQDDDRRARRELSTWPLSQVERLPGSSRHSCRTTGQS